VGDQVVRARSLFLGRVGHEDLGVCEHTHRPPPIWLLAIPARCGYTKIERSLEAWKVEKEPFISGKFLIYFLTYYLVSVLTRDGTWRGGARASAAAVAAPLEPSIASYAAAALSVAARAPAGGVGGGVEGSVGEGGEGGARVGGVV
jgi:hypothetical protein